MTKFFKCLLSALLSVFIIAFLCLGVSAAEVKNAQHELSITVPEDYTVLEENTITENVDLIESLGYSVESFKKYLKSEENPIETLFLAIKSDKESQISLKTWSTEFSQEINDFSNIGDSSLLEDTADKLVSTKTETNSPKKISNKIVSANGMKLVEVRSESTDSGGNFCSVQYFTVRSGKFYSLTSTFTGKINNQKVQSAWDTLVTLHIGNQNESGNWNLEKIFITLLLCVGIIVSVILAILIIISIIKDIKKRRADINESSDYITRRK